MDLQYYSVDEIKHILKNTVSAYRSAENEKFEEFFPKFKKLGIVPNMSKYLDGEADDNEIIIFCDIPGCKQDFHGASAYKTHYNRVHRHLCIECKSSLPTAHLLDLHLCETHDTYFATLVERGKAHYQCFVEECTEVFSTLPERKQHAIKVHKLPPDFRFGLLDGTTKNKAKKKGKSKKAQTNKMEVDEDDQKERNVKFFSFGHSKEKMFNAHSNKALENMKDLKDALPDL